MTEVPPALPREAEVVHQRLLSLHEALARYNASIRVTFPPSHQVARAMDRNTSGWVNDAPFQIREFVLAAEDALFAQLRSCGTLPASGDVCLSEGVAEILDAARADILRKDTFDDIMSDLLIQRPSWCTSPYHATHGARHVNTMRKDHHPFETDK